MTAPEILEKLQSLIDDVTELKREFEIQKSKQGTLVEFDKIVESLTKIKKENDHKGN